jgi:hypothetical protein
VWLHDSRYRNPPSNPNVKAQMPNECILPILYSIGPHPPFDIWILTFNIDVEIISEKYRP